MQKEEKNSTFAAGPLLFLCGFRGCKKIYSRNRCSSCLSRISILGLMANSVLCASATGASGFFLHCCAMCIFSGWPAANLSDQERIAITCGETAADRSQKTAAAAALAAKTKQIEIFMLVYSRHKTIGLLQSSQNREAKNHAGI